LIAFILDYLIDRPLKSLYPYKEHSPYEKLNVNHLKAIIVKILSKEFQVSCPEGAEEQLFAVANYLDQKMREIRKSGRVIGLERIAIMAALNITHELLGERQQKTLAAHSFADQIARLQNKIDRALMEGTAPEKQC